MNLNVQTVQTMLQTRRRQINVTGMLRLRRDRCEKSSLGKRQQTSSKTRRAWKKLVIFVRIITCHTASALLFIAKSKALRYEWKKRSVHRSAASLPMRKDNDCHGSAWPQ